MIRYKCRNCGAWLETDVSLWGMTEACPECDAENVVPKTWQVTLRELIARRKMIRYKCRNCGARLETDISLSGMSEVCPACSIVNTVPKTRQVILREQQELRRRAVEGAQRRAKEAAARAANDAYVARMAAREAEAERARYAAAAAKAEREAEAERIRYATAAAKAAREKEAVSTLQLFSNADAYETRMMLREFGENLKLAEESRLWQLAEFFNCVLQLTDDDSTDEAEVARFVEAIIEELAVREGETDWAKLGRKAKRGLSVAKDWLATDEGKVVVGGLALVAAFLGYRSLDD